MIKSTTTVMRNKMISAYGKPEDAAVTIAKIDALSLKGDEAQDRLIIQMHLKDDPIFTKGGVYYTGNKIWPCEPIVKEFEKLKKRGTLTGMTDLFYEFLHLNFDIARYDKNGYIHYYDNSFKQLWNILLCNSFKKSIPNWKTDVKRIADEILFIMEGK